MSEYGRDESAPTPGGVFRGYFVGECWVFTECFVVISWVFVALLTIRSQRNGRLLAAVGADLSCPHIGIHPQNDERKHVCGEMDMCIYLCQNTGAMNRSPTPSGVFRGYFVGVRCIINNPFAAEWQAVSSRRGRFIAPAYRNTPTK